jgi:hypothetical protein
MCKGRTIFKNPNKPEQPQEGVYEWRAEKKGEKISIYIGAAGGRKESPFKRGTLKRGAEHLEKTQITSDQGKSLDTKFIVGVQ